MIEKLVVDGQMCKRYTVSGLPARSLLKRYNYYNCFSGFDTQPARGRGADMKFWIFFRKFERY